MLPHYIIALDHLYYVIVLYHSSFVHYFVVAWIQVWDAQDRWRAGDEDWLVKMAVTWLADGATRAKALAAIKGVRHPQTQAQLLSRYTTYFTIIHYVNAILCILLLYSLCTHTRCVRCMHMYMYICMIYAYVYDGSYGCIHRHVLFILLHVMASYIKHEYCQQCCTVCVLHSAVLCHNVLCVHLGWSVDVGMANCQIAFGTFALLLIGRLWH